MKTSDEMIKVLKGFEGLSLRPYLCPSQKLTIGYGHVITSIEKKKGELCILVDDGGDRFEWVPYLPDITQGVADRLLRSDLRRYEAAVTRSAKTPLAQHQFDAMVSFAFNVGIGAFLGSTMLKMVNDGDMAGAAAQFTRWNKGGGKILKGLVRRRAAESLVFANGEYA